MTHRSNLKTLAALLLAGAMLASCGGGDAEAPPPPVGPTPPSSGSDTTPPTMTVADNISAATASGPVTFTFVFSEDVGVSFAADDIVVTDGTAGTFTRVSGSQATLVVTPTANATGTMGVSVAAGKFTDLQGNSNTATGSGQQAYDTLVPAVPGNTGTCLAANCVDFSAAGITFGPFENQAGGSVAIVNDPINAANKVIKFVKKPGDGDYFGTTIGGFTAPIVLTSTNKTVTLRVWTPTAGTNFLLKFEGGAGAPTEKDVATTKAGEWETLSFVMPDAGTFTTVVLFPNGRSSVAADKTMYVDELKFPAASGGGGSSSTPLITFDEASAPKLTDFGVNGAPPVIATDPAGGTNKVLKVFKYKLPAPGSEQWAGVTVSTGANDSIPAIPFTATAKTMTMRVYSPAVGVRVRMKVEDAANGGVSVETDAITTTSGAWETLTFNFANPGLSPPVGGGPTSPLDLTKTYNKVSIFSDFGIGNGGSAPLPADRVYYYDDISFVGAPAGGGGGGVACGTTAPTCAPTTTIPAGSAIIYSDASTVAGIVKKPDWGQSPAVVFSEPTIAGNASLKYTFGAPALYEGIDWSASPQNVSTRGALHLDVWSADVANVKVSLIGGGAENGITKTLTAGSWNSLDIDLSLYSSPDKNQIIQMKLEPNVAGTIYVDNIYFYGAAVGGGGGGGTFTGGIFSSDYSGNLGANTAKSDKNGTVGFFVDPRLYAVKIFEDGSVCGSACNPGGVYNFYYGIGKPASPTYSDAYFGGFVNAPGNSTADASSFAKIQLKFWGDAESWEKPNFTAQVNVIVQGPTNPACTNPSGRPEISKTVTAQKIGAGSDYIIPKTDFVLTASCGGAYTVNSVWSAIGSVVVLLSGSSNLNYVNLTPSTPPSYPTFINIGPIKFIN